MSGKRMLLIGAFFICLCGGCEKKYISDSKTANGEDTESTQNFLKSFISGDYGSIDRHLDLLAKEYRSNPRNPKVAAYLGLANLWQIAEYGRATNSSDREIVLAPIAAEAFLEDAIAMQPNWPIMRSFFNSARMLNGIIQQNPQKRLEAYEGFKAEITTYGSTTPIAAFVFAYEFSEVSPSDSIFQEGLDALWLVADFCTDSKFDRANPDLKPYIKSPNLTGNRHICWNSQIAPHFLEGFFTHLGDTLYRKKELNVALIAYNSIRDAPNYASWPFKDMIRRKERIITEELDKFKSPDRIKKANPEVFEPLHGSKMTCGVCHVSVPKL